MTYDFCIIGGGIVGLATAMKLLEFRPSSTIVIIEKESAVATHQTGHNSGVIHAGIYYTPGSLKAKLCRAGASAIKDFCSAKKIPFINCGKMIVATNETESVRLESLVERCKQNAIAIEHIDGTELRRREPNVEGKSAIFSPATGIVNYRLICEAMAEEIRAKGVDIEFETNADSIHETLSSVTVSDRAAGRNWTTRHLIVCGGLQADRLARLAGLRPEFRIIPFRGDYYILPDAKNNIVNHLIYPAPDPALPFLGIHLTRMIDGRVAVGPNAALAFARERYRRFSFNSADAFDALSFSGLWKVLWQHRRSVASELHTALSKTAYLRECQKYCPSLTRDDLLPHRPGIRAQAVMPDGTLVSDFLFAETERTLHVCNAPSPAATSALPIGEMIARKCIGKNQN